MDSKGLLRKLCHVVKSFPTGMNVGWVEENISLNPKAQSLMVSESFSDSCARPSRLGTIGQGFNFLQQPLVEQDPCFYWLCPIYI